MRRLISLSGPVLIHLILGCSDPSDASSPETSSDESAGPSSEDRHPVASSGERESPTLGAPLPPTNADGIAPLQKAPAAEEDEGVATPSPAPTKPAAPVRPPTVVPAPDPGPRPAATCSVTKDAAGFFSMTSPKSSYVVYVPPGYSPDRPMRVVVGLHGCGGDAMNFAQWAVNPWAQRASQSYIGISLGGETGANRCWNMAGDEDKVIAAVDHLAGCFWVDRSRVVIAGYSSGGQLAYRVGLKHASYFAGILIENSGLYAAGIPEETLLGEVSWRINIAHRAHPGDSVFPILNVRRDWQAIEAAQLPLRKSELPGTHEGLSEDWSGFLLPQAAAWQRPASAQR